MAVNWDALLNIKANVSGRGEIQKLGRSLQGVESQYKRLGRTIKNLTVTYFGFRAIQNTVQASIQRTESSRRLTLLAGEYNEVGKALEAAAGAADTFGLSQTQANREFAQIYARLRPVGIGLDDIRVVFDGFNTAAKLGGASATEASAAFLQLSQGLGTGVLRGEELNSVFEQTPLVVVAIAKEMGVAVGEIRDLAKQGRVTGDIVINALRRIKTEGADQLAEALGGPEQAVIEFKNAIEDLQVVLLEELMPQIIPVLKEVTKLLEGIGPYLQAFTALPVAGLGLANKLLRLKNPDAEERVRENIRAGQLPFGGLRGIGTGNDATSRVFQNFSSEYGVGFEAIRKEAEVLKEYYATVGKEINGEMKEVHVSLESVILELMDKYLPVTEEIDKTIKSIKDGTYEVAKATKEAAKEGIKWRESFKGGLEEYLKSIKDTGKFIQDSIVRAFKGMEDALVSFVQTGKLEFSSLVQSILADIARLAIRQSITGPIASALSSAFSPGSKPGKALGGPVVGGASYLVGEQGPEVFTPTGNGNITSNHVLAMDRYRSTGTTATADGVMENGGSISGGGAAVIDLRYDVERINQIDYVTATQFQQGMAQAAREGARRGEQATLHRLQTSASTRRRVGV